jgi:hypothetical protein
VLLLEVDVGDLQLGERRVVAVGVVVDDLPEELDRFGVVRVLEEEEHALALQDLEALPVVGLGRGDLLLRGRAGAGPEEGAEKDEEGDPRSGPPGMGESCNPLIFHRFLENKKAPSACQRTFFTRRQQNA